MNSTPLTLRDRILRVYRRFKSVPIPKTSRLFPVRNSSLLSRYLLETVWDRSDVDRCEKLRFTQHHFLTTCNDAQDVSVQVDNTTDLSFISLGVGFPFPDENGPRLIWDIRSHSSCLRAMCVEYSHPLAAMKLAPSSKACFPESGTFVYLSMSGTHLKTIKLPANKPANVHGNLYSSSRVPIFGATWSSDEERIIYTAEAARVNESESAGCGARPCAFGHHENWGESLSDVRQSVLCMLNIRTEDVRCLVSPAELPNVVPTQPTWCPDDTGIVFMGFEYGPYPLGLVYCVQRPCRLYHLDFATGQIKPISDSNRSASCPRFSPDGKVLIWTEVDVSGPHGQCRALMSLSWPPAEMSVPTTVIPVVQTPTVHNGFPGLYCDLPERCWTSDGRYVVLTTIWGLQLSTLMVPITHASLHHDCLVYPIYSPIAECKTADTDLTDFPSSVTVLDVYHDMVVVSCESAVHPPFVAVTQLPRDENNQICPNRLSICKWCLIPCGGPSLDCSIPYVSGVQHSILTATDIHNVELPYWESLLLQPSLDEDGTLKNVDTYDPTVTISSLWEPLSKNAELYGLVICPHGGPQSAFASSWSPVVAGFLACGFACLLVNYRGSLGYGEQSARSLLGNIGHYDVDDCVQATQCALSQLQKHFNRTLPAVLFGGSHGGFLVLHLSARYPELFRAVVARNPVTNLASMLDTSDIPDWCYTEAGLCSETAWPLDTVPSVDALSLLAKVSPISQLTSGWRVPLLLLLGEKDRRVPVSQGLTFYRRLKAKCPQVPCEVLVFPHDCHPLDSPVTDKEVFIRTVEWFHAHLGSPT
ncbi:unnamed protein product [Dicrocoelium dendriticum]|nr:unnamed protein product [Dicrocoelium dendriticum]